MPQSCFEWLERIKAVEREFWSARIAVERLSTEVSRDPGILRDGPRPRDLRSAGENLEGTYLIRMLAEFETGVRSFWKVIRPRTRTPVEIMLDRVGDRCAIPTDVVDEAQSVRAYRNSLVHDRDEPFESVSISNARKRLLIYVARLPNSWAR
jgi:hypothetical protein